MYQGGFELFGSIAVYEHGPWSLQIFCAKWTLKTSALKTISYTVFSFTEYKVLLDSLTKISLTKSFLSLSWLYLLYQPQPPGRCVAPGLRSSSCVWGMWCWRGGATWWGWWWAGTLSSAPLQSGSTKFLPTPRSEAAVLHVLHPVA